VETFGIGEGRLLPFKDILINPQLSTNIQQEEEFSKKESRPVKPDERRNTEDGLFECSVVGCGKVFRRFEDLELHLDVGKHENTVQSESLYDQLRRDWAEKFLTIDCRKKSKDAGDVESMGAVSSDQNACENRMGWALSKSRAGSIRFSQNVRDYLTERFDLGEITGMKSNPSDVENDMRSARYERNKKRFTRDKWLTASQIKNLFSRLSAARKKHGNEKARVLMSDLESSDLESLLAIAQDICDQELVDSILERLGVQHPIVYDVYNLCDYFKKNKLNVFSVKMLKSICKEFELPFKSKDLKSSLIEKVKDMLAGCTCNS
jgi:Arf-GAP/Rho-GAP domain/ANK repeat/PH domain-containing protein 3